jgi:hypothetical protein
LIASPEFPEFPEFLPRQQLSIVPPELPRLLGDAAVLDLFADSAA